MGAAGALVLGATYRALGVVRSLGRRGIRVLVLRTDEHDLAVHSRYAGDAGRLLGEDLDAQAAHLLALAARHGLGGWTLLPTDDDSTRLLSCARRRLETAFRLTTPEWDVVRIAHDKRRTYELGRRIGIPTPRTWTPSGEAEVRALDPPFPVILKPAFKVPHDPLSAAKAWRVEDAAQLADRYAQARRTLPAEAILVQEVVPGADRASQLSFGALCAEGRVLASITACRVRQRPMDFGKASTLVETIANAEVRALAEHALATMRYTGVVEVEFKRDARDGQLKLLDVNPRTWGWQSLGAAAGVDFPYLEWRLAQGLPVPEGHARPGVRWVRLATDLPTVAGELRAGRLSLGAALRSYRPPVTFATLARDDPRPALVDVPLLARIALRRRLDDRGGRRSIRAGAPAARPATAGRATPAARNEAGAG